MKKTFINTEILTKKDCFAYNRYCNKYNKCNILNELVCSERKCSFYKTQKQFIDDTIKVYK